MSVRTWVGRFTIVDGHAQEEGPWLGSLIRQRPDDDADELYVVVEPASEVSAGYTAQLVDVIARLYAKDPLSLTGALTRSLRAAHEHLREWNRKSLKEHRVAAGATCLALRGPEAYIAQHGPSLAYVLSDGEFRRLQADDAAFEASLGMADEFEPRLTRISLAPGDLVLVASTELDAIVPAEHVQRILERGADDALSELYMLARGRADFSLVLLSCFEQREEPPDYLTRDGDETAAATAPPLGDAQPPVAVGVLADAPDTAPALAEASLAAGGMQDFLPPQRPIAEQVREITESTAPPPATGVRVRGDSATPRYRRSTGTPPIPRIQVPRLLVFGVVALAVLGLLIWWQLPGSVKESREERFGVLLADARGSNARAQSTDDPGARRDLLTQAQMNLADAEKIHADNGEVIALQADVATALGVLNAVFEIREFTTIADLPQQVTGALAVTRAVVGGDYAYLLDAEGGRVLRVALEGDRAAETVFSEGEPAGFVVASRPVQISWSAETESLIILDSQRQAFGYFPDRGSLPLTVRGSDAWGSLDAIAASAGNLYLLDVKEGQVWRYLPGQGGFDSERTALLDPVDLSDATELTVGQDVYVLDNERGIRRFSGRAEAPFPLAGIDRPLLSPASLTVLPGSNRIVVADRGNKRVVIATPEGTFLRQIVSPAFTDLRAVSVDEGNGVLYVLNGDALLKAPFPP
ncbi:MAG: hypothetical protein WEC75_14570 [Dehalococcoidia bacterium]